MSLPRISRALLWSFAAACVLWNPSAQARLLVYEPFDYAPLRTVNGDGLVSALDGGVGFYDRWTEIEGDNPASDPSRVDYIQAGSLQTPGAVGLEIGGNSLRTKNNSVNIRAFAENLVPVVVDDSLWFSFLVRKDVDHTNSTRVQDIFAFALIDSNARSLSVEDNENSLKFSINAGGTEGYVEAPAGPTLGITDFIVVKLSFLPNTVTKMELFLNPVPGVEPTAVSATTTSNPGFGMEGYLTRLNVSTGLASRAQWSFDEFRLGETYGDVAPVPEPASGLLFGCGIAGLALRRFRQRL